MDPLKLSKTVSYALRHNPGKFGLVPDPFGFVPLQDLLTAMNRCLQQTGRTITAEDIHEIIEKIESGYNLLGRMLMQMRDNNRNCPLEELVDNAEEFYNKDHCKTTTIDFEYFNGDIIITDPCYIIPDDRKDDWEKSEYGEYMEDFGFTTYLSKNTPMGDWMCEVFQGDSSSLWKPQMPEKVIGHFAADSGRVGVFYLKDILAYNPRFDDHIKHPLCACLIKNFRGVIKIATSTDPDGDENMHVIGSGSHEFFSRETYWSDKFPYKK